VTGALGALGGHIVRELSHRGSFLQLSDVLPPDKAHEKLQELGIDREAVAYVQVDCTDVGAFESYISQLFLSRPFLTSVVAIVGGTPLQPLLDASLEAFRDVFELNFFAQVVTARAILPHWIERNIPGHFLFTSSLVASLPWRDIPSYRAAKRALEAFSESIALDFAPYGIRSNCIAPGNMAAGTALSVYQEDETYRKTVDSTIPFGSLIDPGALAKTYAWLVSSDAREINGQIIHVDRGQSLPVVGGRPRLEKRKGGSK